MQQSRITTIQDRFIESRDRAMDGLSALIGDIERVQKGGTPAASIKLAQEFQDTASFYVDYVYSENSYGFHAPDYEQRILSQSLDVSRKGQLALRGVTAEELEASDITTTSLNASLRSAGTSSGD